MGIGALGQRLAGSGERFVGAAQGSALWPSRVLAVLCGAVQGAARTCSEGALLGPGGCGGAGRERTKRRRLMRKWRRVISCQMPEYN